MADRASERVVDIHTDGACSGNPGPGGWGAVLRYGTHLKELCGGEPGPTTNNRMELMAAIQALEGLTRPVAVRLHTDSTYVRDGITKWLHAWRRNGWQTAERKPVKNVDLWQRLEIAVLRHRVEWIWVKGHAGNPDNERADALANRGLLNAIGQGRSSSVVNDQSAVDLQARCVHDLVRNQCWECRPGRTKLPDRVAITSGGSVFHLAEHCEALHDGWRQISRQGKTPSDLSWIPIADALTAGRGGCEVCCAHLDL
jgi:ribonuclease HI